MKTHDRFKKTETAFVLVGLVAIILLASATSARAETWTQKADMPTARWGLSASVVDGKIYAIGGSDGSNSQKLEEYDPATDTWTQKADMPTARVFVASVALDGKIYVIGGETSWGGGTKLATVEEYDPATDTWTQRASMSTPRNVLGTSVVNGKIYAIGGGSTSVSLKKVEEYDPITDTWTEKADMPTGRKFLSTSVVNGKIYAVGGQTPNAWPAFSVVEEYDPVTDTWTKKADMPAPRSAPSTCAVGDKIYAFGGTASKGGVPLSTLFQYEPATDTWTAKDDMPGPMAGLSTSAVNGKIYVIGGTSVPHPYDPPLSAVWEYDPNPLVVDFNGDGIVDSADICLMVDHWHTDEPLYDIAPLPFGDDFIDVQDLIMLSEHLFESVDDPTLIAHWTLDETEGDIAQDSAGDNLGFVMGGPVWQPDGGQMDGAIQLDGIDDVVVAGPPLDPADGPFSVLAWVKGGAAAQAIISEPGGPDWLSLDPLTGHLMSELTNSGRGATDLLSQAVITDGDWHKIGFVWDGLYRTLYVDGVVVAEDAQDGLSNRGNGFYIGTGNAMAQGTYFSGLIDDVRIYDRAVSP